MSHDPRPIAVPPTPKFFKTWKKYGPQMDANQQNLSVYMDAACDDYQALEVECRRAVQCITAVEARATAAQAESRGLRRKLLYMHLIAFGLLLALVVDLCIR